MTWHEHCLIHRSVEQTAHQEKHPMATLVPETLQHLSEADLNYFTHWTLCLDLEGQEPQKAAPSQIWCTSSLQRLFFCLAEAVCLSTVVICMFVYVSYLCFFYISHLIVLFFMFIIIIMLSGCYCIFLLLMSVCEFAEKHKNKKTDPKKKKKFSNDLSDWQTSVYIMWAKCVFKGSKKQRVNT